MYGCDMSRHAALSPSRAKDFKQCPLMFRFRTVDRLPEPPSLEALRGTLVHSVLEHLYDGPAAARTEEAAQGLLLPRWNAHLESKPRDRDLFEGPAHLETWLGSARTLIGNYFRMENPTFIEPAAREQFVNARLASGLAVRGIVDRIDEAPDGALRIVDYKTGKSPGPRFQGEALFQMRFYTAAIALSRGKLARRTQIIYLKDGRTLTYDPVPDDVECPRPHRNVPRRRRMSPPRASGPHGREIPADPATPASTSQAPAPRAPTQATVLTSSFSAIRRIPTADTDNFLHYTSRRHTTQIEPRCRRTPATRPAPPNP